jgi:hypothetical protein
MDAAAAATVEKETDARKAAVAAGGLDLNARERANLVASRSIANSRDHWHADAANDGPFIRFPETASDFDNAWLCITGSRLRTNTLVTVMTASCNPGL